MADENDDIIIRKVGGSKVKSSSKNNSEKTDKNQNKDFEKQFNRNIRITTILITIFSLLILISLFSYTPKDELNTQLTFREILGVIRGDDQIISKIETTHNWLGILGAIISNTIYNKTIGYFAIIFPFILIIASIEVFFKKTLTKITLRYFLFFTLLALLSSIIFGVLTKSDWLGAIPKEWSGAFGAFISSITISFIGSIGAFILYLTALILLVVFFTPFSWTKIALYLKPFFDKLSTIYAKLREKFNKNEQNKTEITDIKDLDEDDEFEPAKIISSNEKYDNSKIKINKNALLDSDFIPDLPKKTIIMNTQTSDEQFRDEIKSTEPTYNQEPTPNTPIIENKPISDYKPEIIEIENDKSSNTNSQTKKPLTVYVQNNDIEDEVASPVDFLSTYIHDVELNYTYPSKELLVPQTELEEFIDEEELKSKAKILQEKLETFRIIIEDLNVTPGPVVTQFEFVPAPGIKISRIASLADDIAMALKAKGIRIIAPIPGKGTVGIEIPNHNPALVRFSSLINSSRFVNNNFKLPIALGKTISGEVYCTDLAKMPHLLIAGATGAGKSVGINTIICSLLYRRHPSEVKFVFVDPKKVELRPYVQLENHFIAACPDVEDLIITDPADAVVTLKSVCSEMDQRYDLLSEVNQRNIVDYNDKVKEGAYKKDNKIKHRPLPYIVVVIDELADLMLTASKEVETPIIRLAQLGRAVGIHMIIATQRPSVDVITGIIKANFPARVSYQVASKIDSRTIIDVSGAEQLLGNGDMLFLSVASPKPIRLQNSFLSTDEVESICNFIGEQKGYPKPYMLPSIQEDSGERMEIDPNDRDVLFEEAARIVIRQQQASVSMIQRRLKVGYARAGRIIDELEAAGIIGPYDGSKARIVLLDSESQLEAIL